MMLFHVYKFSCNVIQVHICGANIKKHITFLHEFNSKTVFIS